MNICTELMLLLDTLFLLNWSLNFHHFGLPWTTLYEVRYSKTSSSWACLTQNENSRDILSKRCDPEAAAFTALFRNFLAALRVEARCAERSFARDLPNLGGVKWRKVFWVNVFGTPTLYLVRFGLFGLLELIPSPWRTEVQSKTIKSKTM